MASLAEHPDQSWEAILRAREGIGRNPAPPRNTPVTPIDLSGEPGKPKFGQPGFEYPKVTIPPPSKGELLNALRSMGLDFGELQASLDGLMMQNKALLEENKKLKVQAEAAEFAAERTPQEDIAEAEFENIPEKGD